MLDPEKINLAAVSETFGRLAEAAQLQQSKKSMAEGLSERFERIEGKKIEEESSPEEKALIERLKMKLDNLHERYEKLMEEKEKKIRFLEKRLELVAGKKFEAENSYLLKEKVSLLEEKYNRLRLDSSIPKYRLENIRKRLEEAKEKLKGIADAEEEVDENLKNDKNSESTGKEEETSQAEEDGEIEEQEENEGETAEKEEQINDEAEDEETASAAEPAQEGVYPENEDISKSIDERRYNIPAQVSAPEWLQAEEHANEIKAPSVPSVEEKEETFSPLPELNSDEKLMPLEGEEEKKTTLADKLKHLFKK